MHKETPDVHATQRVQHALESSTAKTAAKIMAIVLAAVITVLLSLILVAVNGTNSNAEKALNVAQAVRDHNYEQDQSLALLQVEVQSQKSITNAMVANIQALTLQITHISDKQEQLNDAQKTLIQQARPPR